MKLIFSIAVLKSLLPLLAIVAGIFVISTKNAIISVFNLIVLYILVAFYLIYIGITYLGLSYIIIYIGAIAILFLFIIMIIDVEVVEKRSNNYLPLLFLLLSGFFLVLKNILYNIGLIKMKSIKFKEELILMDNTYGKLFNTDNFSRGDKNEIKNEDLFNEDKDNNYDFYYDYLKNNNNKEEFVKLKGNLHKYKEWLEEEDDNVFFQDKINYSPQYFKDCLSRSEERDKNNIDISNEYNTFINNNDYISKKSGLIDNSSLLINYPIQTRTNYLLVIPNWDSAVNRITQITAIGDILYTVYHSYIYILSVILLLGMIGAIILTADNYQEIKVINISKTKKSNSNIFLVFDILKFWYWSLLYNKKKEKFYYIIIKFYKFINININKFINSFNNNKITKKSIVIPSFFHTLSNDYLHSEDILGNLIYFILANLIIALLLLGINSYFSLSVKYLEKEGGFECGFTSFVQTRERFNVIFYRVSLLFLIFDLEIILAFPYTAIYQKNQNISKNNVLAFLYILIVGFIYELKEGALNIVKKAHSTDININN